MLNLAPNKSALHREGGAIAFLFLALLLFYFPVIFGNRTVFSSDTVFFNFPMYHFLYRAYHEGFIPFWQPNLFGGLPFMAALQSSVFYPPSVIFFLDDFTRAFNLSLALHHGILVAGTYALMRFWGFSPTAALCSGLTAFLGGFFLSTSNFCNHFHSIAWFPWFFLFLEKWLVEKSIRYFLLAVTACSMQTLAGSPEYSILSTLLIFSHSLWVRRNTQGNPVLRKSFLMGLTVLTSLAITSFQLIPTYLLAQNSIRDSGLRYADHARWSLEPSTLTNLLFATSSETVSQAFQSTIKPAFLDSIYMGIVPAFCLVAAVLFLKTNRSILFWWIVFWVGIFFALGKFNPLYPWFFDWVPLLHKFRYPEKFFFLSAFSMTFLVGMVVNSLLTSLKTDSARYKYFFWSLLGVLAVGGVLYSLHPETKSFYSLIFLALFGLSLGLHFQNRIPPALFSGITAFIILIDLMTHNQIYMVLTDRKYFDEVPPVVETLAQDQEVSRIFTQANLFNGLPGRLARPKHSFTLMNYQDIKNILQEPIGTLYGLQTIQGTLGLETRDHGIFNHIFNRTSLQEKLRILGRSNVKYIITATNWEQMPSGGLVNPKAQITRINALPRAFLVPTAQVMDWQLIPETYFSADFDPMKRVLISEPVNWESSPAFQGEVTHLVYKPNRVEIQTRQKGGGFLVLLDAYYPGWHATVDGQEVRVLRGNHFFRTLPLDEGDHQVVFYYEQEGFRTGLMISLTALILVMVWGVWQRFSTHKKKALPTETPFH